jgi:LytS/YehU family sensor histidine kinase
MHRLRTRFPDIKQTRQRLLTLAVLHICLTSLTFVTLFYAYDAFSFLGYTLSGAQLINSLLVGVGLNMIATSMWESEYTFNQWKRSHMEMEQLEELSIQQEFDTLKNQVNPHFLFNCLNTLSSLISEDTKQAEQFLNELSKVYRYLLRNNEDGLSTLDTEIKFIDSYYRLLKTRHGEAVQLKIEIDTKYKSYLLPSLTLQMLVENAVKHNALSRNKPLMIDIFTTAGNKLVVNNNIQQRLVKGPSNKIGLENIKNKYSLLAQPGFQVLEDVKSFSVILPLIWSKTAQNKKALVNYKTYPNENFYN